MTSVIFKSGNQMRSNKIFQTIKNFETLFYDEFQKTGIVRCGHCRSTGFQHNNINELCIECGGMGYTGFKKLAGEFVCRTCNGYGCMLCNNKGTVDWITHANNSDIMETK